MKTHSIFKAHEQMNRSFIGHSLSIRGAEDKFMFDYKNVHLPNLSLHKIAFGVDIEAKVPPFKNFYTVMIALDGCVTVVCQGKKVEVAPNNLIVINPNQQTHFFLEKRFRQLTLRVERTLLERAFQPDNYRDIRQPIHFEFSAWPATQRIGDLVQLLEQVWNRLNSGDDRSMPENLQKSWEELIAATLLDTVPNDCKDKWQNAVIDESPASLIRAERYIFKCLADDLTVAKISTAAEIAPSTLRSIFVKYRAMSPMEFVRFERLKLAHRLLVEGSCNSVTDAAFSSGFSHLGKFSERYRKLFGESPSRTLSLCRLEISNADLH